MLGNNADAFFTTPMATSIRRGGNAAFASHSEMPAPWTNAEFLPGVGQEGSAAVDTSTRILGLTVPVAIGLTAAAFLIFTKPGARLRAKIGF